MISKELEEKKSFIDLLKRAQAYSLDDQRGPIDSRNLEMPEFLLSANLVESRRNYFKYDANRDQINYSIVNRNNNSRMHKPTASINCNELAPIDAKSTSTIDIRSPVMIVYDNDDDDENESDDQQQISYVWEHLNLFWLSDCFLFLFLLITTTTKIYCYWVEMGEHK